MPSLKRQKRELEQKLRADVFGPISEHLLNADMTLNKIAESGLYGTNFMKHDENGEPFPHNKLGVGGNDSRHADRKDAALELQRRHSDVWGNRGAAGIISRREQRANPHNKLAERTIQKYIKDYPLK